MNYFKIYLDKFSPEEGECYYPSSRCHYPSSRYRSYPNRLPPFVHDYFLSSRQLHQAAASSESKSSARFSYRLNVQATVSLHTLWTGLTVSQIHKSTVYILVHPDIVRSVSASTSTLRFAGSPASSEPMNFKTPTV